MASAAMSNTEYLNQDMTMNSPDGPVSFAMGDLEYYVYYGVRNAINLGTQIGASAALLLVLILLTHADKRRSTVFILNALALPLNVIRTTLGACYYTGPFYHPYRYFTFDFSGIPATAYGVSITADVFTLLVLIIVETSLVFQIRIAAATVDATKRFWLMVLSISIAMIATGFRFALVVVASRATVDLQPITDMNWLPNATNITTTISICTFCAIFLVKLGCAIVQRRRLGITKFGPMQAIFIIGSKTFLVPALFSTFEYIGPAIELSSQTLTVCTLFLPLSSMWASATLSATPTKDAKKSGSGFADMKALNPSYMSGSTAVEMKSPGSKKPSHWTDSEKDTDLDESGSAV